jgi:hypothetical protein
MSSEELRWIVVDWSGLGSGGVGSQAYDWADLGRGVFSNQAEPEGFIIAL